MTFLHLGLAVAGVACVAIPIIIHLLMRRRRRPVMWGAMRFLIEAYKRQRRRLMLEKWLLLLTRCAVVALAGLAIARPLLLGGAGGAGGRTVYLLIDNGLASTAVGEGGKTALARHKETAAKVLAGLGQSASAGDAGADRVALIAMGGPAQGVVVPASAAVAGVARLVESMEPTDSRTDVPGAMALATAAIEGEMAKDSGGRNRRVFVVVLSDFLDGSADVAAGGSSVKFPAGVKVVCSAPTGGPGDNIAVTGVDPLRTVLMSAGAGTENVRVTVRRSGPGTARESAAALRVRMEQVGARGMTAGRAVSATARFAPGQEETTASVQVPVVAKDAAEVAAGTGAAVLVAQIDPMSAGADVIAGDSVCRRPVEVREILRIGLVSPRRFGERARVDQLDSAEWVRLALRPGDGPSGDSGIEVVEIEPAGVDAARLAGLDGVVVPRPDLVTEDGWRRLGAFATGGGLVAVMPPGGEAGAGVQLWSDKMVRELGLSWTLAREVKVVGLATDDGGARIVAGAPAVTDSASAGGVGGAGAADLLGMVRAEAEELTRPVRVFKVLPIEAGGAGAVENGERVLSLADGTVLVWAGGAGGAGEQKQSQNLKFEISNSERARTGDAANSGGRGLVVYIASALELGWTDLPARPLMVPLMQEVIKQGVGRARGSWWAMAGRNAPAPGRAVELTPVEAAAVAPASEREPAERLVVDASGQTTEAVRRAGLWRAIDDRGGMRGLVAVNADWRGGRTGPQPKAEVERWLRTGTGTDVAWIGGDEMAGEGGVSSAIAALFAGGKQGPPISLPLLIAAAALALLEIWLARWASHAEIGSSVPAPVGKGVATA